MYCVHSNGEIYHQEVTLEDGGVWVGYSQPLTKPPRPTLTQCIRTLILALILALILDLILPIIW
jgi:hypothetical protein